MCQLAETYLFYRQRHLLCTPRQALAMARRDIAAEKPRKVYVDVTRGAMRGGTDWKLCGDNVFFCECPDTYLRRVGFADQHSRAIKHTGWWLTDDGDGESARGVVFQLPARNGKPRFISGIADPFNNGAAIISLELFDDKADAAINADWLAERYAEKERDYNRAWRAGQEYSELGSTIAQARKDALAVLKARRDHIRAGDSVPTILKVLECKAFELIDAISEARGKRETLREQYGNCDAFNEGKAE